MLTLKAAAGSSIILSDGKNDIVVFPKKAVKDAINLLAVPEEEPKGSVLSWPGEYDINGIAIRGIGRDEGQHVSYTVQIDELRVALPASPIGEWIQADIERLGDVHVLVIPAEDPKACQALIEEVDPRLLVIVPGSDGTLNAEVLKIAGATGKEAVSEYKVKGALATEGRETVVLSA